MDTRKVAQRISKELVQRSLASKAELEGIMISLLQERISELSKALIANRATLEEMIREQVLGLVETVVEKDPTRPTPEMVTKYLLDQSQHKFAYSLVGGAAVDVFLAGMAEAIEKGRDHSYLDAVATTIVAALYRSNEPDDS